MIRAQRLSASKIVAAGVRARIPTAIRRAQRLSASKIVAARKPLGVNDPMIVLNAFRHQRSWQRVSKKAAEWYEHVLNAFRHQRSWQTACHRHGLENAGCSTPFGIKDRGSPAFEKDAALSESAQRLSASKIVAGDAAAFSRCWCRVLNAFRHQRSWQQYPGSATR